jgi:tetratricopeptide (TPR) repeat protein
MNTLLISISCILFLVYSNTFQAAWHLDDEPNILNNSKLHITELNFQQINDALRANPSALDSDKLYRPLPCFTFGLNWYVGQDKVFGYHLVNLAVHIFTAWFLFLTLHLLLKIYYHERDKQQEEFFLAAALLGSLFWALAPIQTQAVTYIVQRMASMAAMFTIIAIYTYLRGRTEKKNIWFILCLFSFFAALASKENAILLPASLVLIEFSFFPHQITQKQMVRLFCGSILVLTAGFIFVRYGLGLTPFNLSNPLSFLDSYTNRSFTFTERILTQPRIVLMYLSQIFVPVADRLSIEHDIALSRSLFSPWTTLPAILLIFGGISTALIFLKKQTLLCFPILFFFLNHAVESTILQLEMVFEHRNYLPSFFLFLPLGVLIANMLHDRKSPLFRRGAVTCCTILFLIIFGHATYTRNLAWANEGTLWTDAIRKAPNSARAAHYLGKWHMQFGQFQPANYFFQRSLDNSESAADPKYTKGAALNGLASVVYMIGNYDKSLQYFTQCLEIDATDEACLKNRALAYLQLGQPEKALFDGLKLTEKYPVPVEYQYLTAAAAYQTDAQDIALNRMQQVVSRALGDQQVMYLTGLLMMKKKAYSNSLFFFKQAARISPSDIDSQLALAAAYHASNQAELTEKLLDDILKKHPLPVIVNALQVSTQHNWDSDTVSFIDTHFYNMIKNSSVRHESAKSVAP